MKQNKIKIFIVAFVTLLLFFTSQFSMWFLYNRGSEQSIYIIMSKSFLNGKVLYKDIFDSNGPYLYLIYSIGVLFSWGYKTFNYYGIFLLEVIFMSLTFINLVEIFKVFKINITIERILMLITLFMFINFQDFSIIGAGATTEEWILLPTSYILKILIQKSFNQKKLLSNNQIILISISLLFTIFVKFYLALPLIFMIIIINIKLDKSIYYNKYFLLPLLIGTLPLIIYFSINHGIISFISGYFIDNIFNLNIDLFGKKDLTYIERMIFFFPNFISKFVEYNVFLLIFHIYSIKVFMLSNKIEKNFKTLILLLLLLTIMSNFISFKTDYPCYLQVNTILSVFHIFALGQLKLKVKQKFLITFASLFTILLFNSDTWNCNRFQKGKLFEKKLMNIVKKDSFALYDINVYGMYSLSDYLPQNKYFYMPNFNEEYKNKIRESQDYKVDENKVKYIVTSSESYNNHIVENKETYSKYKKVTTIEGVVILKRK